MASCSSCGHEIEWRKSATTGKWIPLDIGEASDGNLVVVKEAVRGYTPDDARLFRERRRSHFVTCPQANQWRRG